MRTSGRLPRIEVRDSRNPAWRERNGWAGKAAERTPAQSAATVRPEPQNPRWDGLRDRLQREHDRREQQRSKDRAGWVGRAAQAAGRRFEPRPDLELVEVADLDELDEVGGDYDEDDEYGWADHRVA